jgi:plasmid maintenance system killer protein
MEWVIVESKKAKKDIEKAPRQIQAAYSAWKRVVKFNGPSVLYNFKGYHHEKLKGKREGQHSCRLSKFYRVIFAIKEKEISVNVIEVNKHDY